MDYNGVRLPEPAEGEIALGAIVLMKVMRADGEITYRELTSDNLHPIEMLGMIETARDTLKAVCMGRLRSARPTREGDE